MSKPSIMFMASRPGTKGRRRFRKLDDEAIMRADQKGNDPEHQLKFLNRSQREAFLLKKIATR